MGKPLSWQHVLNTHALVGGDFDETAKLFLDNGYNSVFYARYKRVLGGFHRFASAELKAQIVALIRKDLSTKARLYRLRVLLQSHCDDINRKRNEDGYHNEVYFDHRMGALHERTLASERKQQEQELQSREEARLRVRAPNESPKLYRKRLRRQGA